MATPQVGEAPGMNPALFIGINPLLLNWLLSGFPWELGFVGIEPRSLINLFTREDTMING